MSLGKQHLPAVNATESLSCWKPPNHYKDHCKRRPQTLQTVVVLPFFANPGRTPLAEEAPASPGHSPAPEPGWPGAAAVACTTSRGSRDAQRWCTTKSRKPRSKALKGFPKRSTKPSAKCHIQESSSRISEGAIHTTCTTTCTNPKALLYPAKL